MNHTKKTQTKFSKAIGFGKGNQDNLEQLLNSTKSEDYTLLPFNLISLVRPGFYEIRYCKTGETVYR